MAKKEKYIVTKGLSMGYVKISCPIGTIIDVDRTNSTMTINGTEYKDTRDIDIAIRISDKKGPIVIPYDISNPAIKEILDSVKAKLAAKEKAVKETLPIVMSDRDLLDDINIEHTKIAAKKTEAKPKDAKMEVLKESDATLPLAKRVEENLKKKVEDVYNRPKMKVVKEGQDTVKKTLAESAKAKVSAPKGSVSFRKKG